MEYTEVCESIKNDPAKDLCQDPQADLASADPYGLPFEPIDSVSDDPLEFEELAHTLWDILTDTYILSAQYNRRSPYYLVLCSHLEKNIKQMGSLCVTKAVLEQRQCSFTRLEGMTVQELYTMVSLHFRKCYAAYKDLQKEGSGFDIGLLDWVCRWGLLAEKLKATEKRICDIRSGKINPDKLLEKEQSIRKETRAERPQRDPNAMRNAASLPILRSYAADLVRRKKLAERQKAREEREIEKEAKKSLPGGARPFRPMTLPNDAESMRNFLLVMARAKNDQFMIQKLNEATQEELEATLHHFLEDQSDETRPERRPDPPPRSGPSDAVRKILREKRKKKKK